MMRRIVGLAALALMVSLLASAQAQDKEPPKKPLTDADFTMQVSAADLAEINLGRLAVRQATSEDVKRFAQRMVDDHSKASTEMIALVNKKQGLGVAPQMDQKHRELSDRILRLRGADFDRDYMMHMVEDHRMAVV